MALKTLIWMVLIKPGNAMTLYFTRGDSGARTMGVCVEKKREKIGGAITQMNAKMENASTRIQLKMLARP